MDGISNIGKIKKGTGDILPRCAFKGNANTSDKVFFDPKVKVSVVHISEF